MQPIAMIGTGIIVILLVLWRMILLVRRRGVLVASECDIAVTQQHIARSQALIAAIRRKQ